MASNLDNVSDRYVHRIANDTYEMEQSAAGGVRRAASTDELLGGELPGEAPKMTEKSVVKGMARHTLGLLLLLAVVFLWTASNFLGSVGADLRRVVCDD